jgi:hypothetical protein
VLDVIHRIAQGLLRFGFFKDFGVCFRSSYRNNQERTAQISTLKDASFPLEQSRLGPPANLGGDDRSNEPDLGLCRQKIPHLGLSDLVPANYNTGAAPQA